MFNLSTLSGINLKTDNYFQYTSHFTLLTKEDFLKDSCKETKLVYALRPLKEKDIPEMQHFSVLLCLM